MSAYRRADTANCHRGCGGSSTRTGSCYRDDDYAITFSGTNGNRRKRVCDLATGIADWVGTERQVKGKAGRSLLHQRQKPAKHGIAAHPHASCAEPTQPQLVPFHMNPTVRRLLITVVVGRATPIAAKLSPQVMACAVPLSLIW